MSYVLSRRQRRLYGYQGSVYRASTYQPPGDPTGKYSAIETALPGYLQSTPDPSVPTEVGLIQQDILEVLDLWHFPQGADVQAGDFWVCTLQPINPVSKQVATELLGLWWTVRANFRPHFRLANKFVVEMKREPSRTTTVLAAATSATQNVASTAPLRAGSLIYCPSAGVFRTVDHIIDATHLVLDQSVATTLNEVLRLPPPGF